MAKAPGGQNSVAKLYQTVIEDVINNIREAFLDDGVDEHVLQELKQTWEQKLAQSKAVENSSNELRHAQSVMPLYVYANSMQGDKSQQPLVYHTMTAAGQQAAMSLPNSVLYQRQQHPNQQVYAPYQPGTSTNQQSTSGGGKQHPSVIIQADGANDQRITQVDGANDQRITQVDGANDQRITQVEEANDQRITQVDGANDQRITQVDEANDQRITQVDGANDQRITQVDGANDQRITQVDGANADSSSEEDDDDDEDEVEEEEEAVDEEPLCSADDGSDDDPVELFDTDNVVVCQYDKIHRAKCRWKFNLKVGIMNLNGKDLVFQKATGEAEW
uniref:TFIIA-alpha and beta-like factor n=1 Tax=Ciona intestinalis TaxID=7719 RepID=F6WII1_CIOIN|nr:TFIIA-alpha and beta-like factor isoform X1 [Ciona intestinalis]|eukprot:XP_002131438.1 TFIIA-alpha and beta-like factor isoform X1 [Ciona intestinalis]